MTDNEDLGAPVAYLVLRDGTPVFESSGTKIGEVAHVIADDQKDVFHGLLVKTGDGHRFASATQVEGVYERGVIVNVPAAQLLEPSEDGPAGAADESLQGPLKQAWNWLVQPR
jgi:uncharacterized protein YrrD